MHATLTKPPTTPVSLLTLSQFKGNLKSVVSNKAKVPILDTRCRQPCEITASYKSFTCRSVHFSSSPQRTLCFLVVEYETFSAYSARKVCLHIARTYNCLKGGCVNQSMSGVSRTSSYANEFKVRGILAAANLCIFAPHAPTMSSVGKWHVVKEVSGFAYASWRWAFQSDRWYKRVSMRATVNNGTNNKQNN